MKKLIGVLLTIVLVMGAMSGLAADVYAQMQSVVFTDSNANMPEVNLPDEGSVKVKADFVAPFSGEATVFAAQYKSASAISKVEIIGTVDMTAGENVNFTSESITVSEAGTLKVYIWGGDSKVKPVLKVPAVIQKQGAEGSVVKFEKAENAPEAYLINTTVKLGDVFDVCDGMEDAVNTKNVQVFGDESVTFTPDASDWKNGTLVFSKPGDISLTITDYNYCVPAVVVLKVKEPDPVAKFEVKADAILNYTKGDTVKLGDLFAEVEGAQINDAMVLVTSESEDVTITYISDSEDWTNATVKFDGVGDITLTVTDNDYCIPASVSLKVEYNTVTKFAKVDSASEVYTLGDVVTLGSLFAEIEGVEPAVKADAVSVSAVNATYTLNAENWKDGTIAFDKIGEVIIEITDGFYCVPTVITINVKEPDPVAKFEAKEVATFKKGDVVKVGDIFAAIEGAEIDSANVAVTSDSEIVTITNASDWTESTVEFTGVGEAVITITDKNYCIPTTATVSAEYKTVKKFAKADSVAEVYTLGDKVTLGSLFAEIEGVEPAVKADAVSVNATNATYTLNADWKLSEVVFDKLGEVTIEITDGFYCVPTVITLNVKEPDPIAKFEVKADAILNYTKGDTVKLGDLFAEVEGAQINDAMVLVTSESEDVTITYISDSEEWTNATVKFNGVGEITLTVTDNDYCIPASVSLKVEYNTVTKFAKVDSASEVYTLGDVVTVADLFAEIEGVEPAVKADAVSVSAVNATYTLNAENWKDGTIAFDKIGEVTVEITDGFYCVPTVITLNVKEPDPVAKFEAKEVATFKKGDVVKVGDIFAAIEGAEIDSANVDVTSDSEIITITNASDWTESTVEFTGVGEAVITITDNNYCIPTTATVSAEYKTVAKFAKADSAAEEYTLGDVVTLGDIFAAIEGVEPAIKADAVSVNATNATYTLNADWTLATVTFDKAGEVTIEITDGFYCIPAVITVNVKEPEPVDKFTVKFPNTDKYLYRVGNTGDVALGSLFEAIEGVEIGNVTATVTSLDSTATASGAFTAKSDWKKATIDFNGAGPVEVKVYDDKYANPLTLKLEVIDATNATTAASATSSNIVLLNDVSGGMSVSGGYTFYGNGFTVDVGTSYVAAGTQTGFIGRVNLYGGNLDNVKIVGPVYPVANIYQEQAKDTVNNVTNYFYNTVIINSGECKITNSYISGSRAALCIKSGSGDLLVENTTLACGVFANFDIKNSATTTLRNVTTIQEELPNSYGEKDSSGNIKSMIGMGIVIDNESAKLNIEGTFNQYNWVNQTQWNSMVPSSYQSYFPQLFSDSKFAANRHKRDGDSTEYVNTGILTITNWNSGANIADNRTDKTVNYAKTNVSLGGKNGGLYSVANAGTLTDALYYAPEYASDNYAAVAPKATFDYTTLNNDPSDGTSNVYCYYDTTSKKYMISFDEGGSRVWNGNILTLKKGDKALDYTMSVSGGLSVAPDNTITFSDAGEYTVTYIYTDEDNYRFVNGQIEKYSVTYTETVDFEVFEIEAAAVPTAFNFLSKGYRTETINDVTYAMPDVIATVDSNTAGIRKTTIGGVDVYYPVVSMHKSGSSSWYNYFSVFEGVTITDCDQTTVYNTSTTSMPSGLEVIGGFILDSTGAVSSTESANGTGIFNYATGKEIKLSTYSSYGLCYYPDSKFSKTGTTDRAEQTIVAKYRYTDSNGKQYYYYIGYWCEKHTKTSVCVTPDTLVTLADDSQKRIDSVSTDDVLKVWNFEEGEYAFVPAAMVRNHGYDYNTVIALKFDDGTVTKAINEHGYFDADLNKFVLIDENSAYNFVGHNFIKEDGDGYTTVKLKNVSVSKEYIEAYSILSVYHFNFITDSMFSLTSTVIGMDYLMPFEVGENMKYDEVKKNADIEKYGLYSYEEVSHLVSYDWYIATNCAYMKVSVGKGYITWEDILKSVEQDVNA